MKLREIGMALSGVLLAASLVACGGSQSASSTSSDGTTNEASGTVYKIVTDTTFTPFEYAEADGTYAGIDVDLLAAVAEDQGFQYELSPVGFEAALQNVQAGQADGMIAGMSINEERKEVFDFSEPYYDSTVCAAAAKEDIKSLDDLKDKNVAVKSGTMSQAWAESIADQYGFTMTTFTDSPTMYQDVLSGHSAACFEDTPAMSYAISTGSVKLNIIGEVDSSSEFASPYGFAVAKGSNAELLEKFNKGLANIKSSGKYDEIINKYVKTSE